MFRIEKLFIWNFTKVWAHNDNTSSLLFACYIKSGYIPNFANGSFFEEKFLLIENYLK